MREDKREDKRDARREGRKEWGTGTWKTELRKWEEDPSIPMGK